MREIVAAHGPAVEALALALRRIVLDVEPGLAERTYPGWRAVGYRHPDAGYVCGLFPREDRATLVFERGAELDDPDGLLTGSGTQTREVVLRPGGPIDAAGIGRLVRRAVD